MKFFWNSNCLQKLCISLLGFEDVQFACLSKKKRRFEEFISAWPVGRVLLEHQFYDTHELFGVEGRNWGIDTICH